MKTSLRAVGIFTLALLLTCDIGRAERTFNYDELRASDGYGKIVRELYPKSELLFQYFEARSNIFFSVYQLVENQQFLFVVSEEESTLTTARNGKKVNPEEVFTPRKIKVFDTTALPGGGTTPNENTLEMHLGYLLSVNRGDRISIQGTYPTDDRKALTANYDETEGWRIDISPSPGDHQPDNAQQDQAQNPSTDGHE